MNKNTFWNINEVNCLFFKLTYPCKLWLAIAMSGLLYGCTTWTLTKCQDLKLDEKYTKCCFWISSGNLQNNYCTTTDLPSHKPFKKEEQNLLATGWTHKWRSPINSNRWAHEYKLTSSKWTLDAFERTCQGWWPMIWKNQGNLCCWHALMTMMIYCNIQMVFRFLQNG